MRKETDELIVLFNGLHLKHLKQKKKIKPASSKVDMFYKGLIALREKSRVIFQF